MSKLLKVLLFTTLIAGLVLGLGSAAVTQAAPGDVLFRINAGGDATGVWVADTGYYNQGNVETTTETIDTTGMPAYATEAIFQSHRWDPSGDPDLIYTFDVTGLTTVDVNLFFAEIYDFSDGTGPGDRVFDVYIEGTLVLNDYDVYVEAGNAMNKAVMESFTGITVTGDTLEISFVRQTAGAAMVSAIEVIDQTPVDGTMEPTVEPTVEPTEAPILPAIFCNLNDGSLNAQHCGRPIAVFEDGGDYEVYGIDINTGNGALAFILTAEEIAAAGEVDAPFVLVVGENPYNFRPITVYLLPDGGLQINTFYWDGKPYVIGWGGDNGFQTLEW